MEIGRENYTHYPHLVKGKAQVLNYLLKSCLRSDKGIVSKIHKELLKLNGKETSNTLLKMTKVLNRPSPKRM